MHFLDVGQGDSIFIDSGDFEILIDAGNNQYGEKVSDYIQSHVHDNLEIVVATHPDADHIGGLDVILKNYSVDTIIDSGKKHTTKTYNDYINTVLNEYGAVFIHDSDMSFTLGEGVFFSVIELVDEKKDNNENSVVSMLSVDKFEFLFTGDLISEIEIEFLEKFKDIDVLKIAHHGSRTSTSIEFLNATQPEYAIISCGYQNRYGHPHREVLERLQEKNIEIYRTDIQGTVIATITDNEIIFTTEK